MSDESMKQPLNDFELPAELSDCESMLAGYPLPGSRVDRDELLYRAGWAAAESALNQPSSPVLETPSGWRQKLTWSVVSATIAASLAVVTTLAWLPIAGISNQVVDKTVPGNIVPKNDVSNSSTSSSIQTNMQPPPKSYSSRYRLSRWSFETAPLLAMRDAAIQERWYLFRNDFAVGYSNTESQQGTNYNNPPATSRDLLNEYLERFEGSTDG